MTEELTRSLAAFYDDHVLKNMPKLAAASGLIKALATDPESLQAARERLEELERLNNNCAGNLDKRCFVSHIHRIALKEALHG